MIGAVAARAVSARHVARALPVRLEAWLRFQTGRHHYRLLGEEELRSTRRSDKLFIFGSGYSINDLTPAECRRFEQYDTLGFNWFVRQRIVRVDYQVVREIPDTDLDRAVWQRQLREYFELVRDTPLYAETVFLVQTGFHAINGNRAIGYRLIPEASPIFLWRSAAGRSELGRSFADGLSHPNATLEECVNFGVLMGWKDIVLVGVDLYDRRYFWLRPDETRSNDELRGATYRDPHARAGTGMIETIGGWAGEIERQGRTIWVYNPSSLFAEVLPVYPREPVAA